MNRFETMGNNPLINIVRCLWRSFFYTVLLWLLIVMVALMLSMVGTLSQDVLFEYSDPQTIMLIMTNLWLLMLIFLRFRIKLMQQGSKSSL